MQYSCCIFSHSTELASTSGYCSRELKRNSKVVYWFQSFFLSLVWFISVASAARHNYVLVYWVNNVQANSSPEHPPQANPGHLIHDESRGPGRLAVNSVPPPPGICKQQKICFVTSCRHFLRFPTAFRVKVSSSQALPFWSSWRTFIDHKRPIKAIKTFALSFLQSEWLISWPVLCSSIELKLLCLLKNGN